MIYLDLLSIDFYNSSALVTCSLIKMRASSKFALVYLSYINFQCKIKRFFLSDLALIILILIRPVSIISTKKHVQLYD